ncbi:MAG: copper-translocating P-type ATPase [Alphaproteobacteria bacterium]|nr:copper-translocating P-type ATPase [Alphaproteobacteria bacterium]
MAHAHDCSQHAADRPAPTGSERPKDGYICPMCPDVWSPVPADCPSCGMALEPARPQKAETKVEYTCPMHPEIVRDAPGDCPICGMALEPRTVTAETPPNPELVDMTRRFWGGLALTIPVFLLAMGEFIPPLEQALAGDWARWVQLVLTTPIMFWAGWPFFVRGWKSIRTVNPNMFTLIAIGTGAAYLFSVVAVIAPQIFPAGFLTAGGAAPLYFETAGVIITLMLLGQVLELRARERTGDALKALIDLAPKTAIRLTDCGHEREVGLDQVQVGDRLRVRPGDSAPVDGVVLEGTAVLDESMVTGESKPVTKRPDDPVIGGTIVQGSTGIVMRAEKVGDDTMLSRIVALVADAQRSRAPIQSLADRVAGIFVPTVVVIAIASFAVWALVGPPPALAYGLAAAVTVLIIACPCALGLATPMSVMTGVGRGAQAGVLIRNAEAIERIAKIDTLVLDKTGTLTEGKPAVEAIETAGGASSDELLRRAAALERASGHPLARAFVEAAEARGLSLPATPDDYEQHDGKGIVGAVDGARLAIGNAAMMRVAGADPAPLEQTADGWRDEGATAVFVALDGRLAGVVKIADPIKETTAEAIEGLHRAGVRLVMLTGDNAKTAQAVARRLGLDEVEAEVMPEDKHAVVERLQKEGRRVAMAGDGVNDAPALARADVGIAMGAGADVAIESAHVTLVKGDLRGVLRARTLGRAVMRNIRQNLFFAFIYNGLGVPVAAGVLYPVFGLLLSPMIAAAAMSLSSVSVIGNALRLRRQKL